MDDCTTPNVKMIEVYGKMWMILRHTHSLVREWKGCQYKPEFKLICSECERRFSDISFHFAQMPSYDSFLRPRTGNVFLSLNEILVMIRKVPYKIKKITRSVETTDSPLLVAPIPIGSEFRLSEGIDSSGRYTLYIQYLNSGRDLIFYRVTLD